MSIETPHKQSPFVQIDTQFVPVGGDGVAEAEQIAARFSATFNQATHRIIFRSAEDARHAFSELYGVNGNMNPLISS